MIRKEFLGDEVARYYLISSCFLGGRKLLGFSDFSGVETEWSERIEAEEVEGYWVDYLIGWAVESSEVDIESVTFLILLTPSFPLAFTRGWAFKLAFCSIN